MGTWYGKSSQRARARSRDSRCSARAEAGGFQLRHPSLQGPLGCGSKGHSVYRAMDGGAWWVPWLPSLGDCNLLPLTWGPTKSFPWKLAVWRVLSLAGGRWTATRSCGAHCGDSDGWYPPHIILLRAAKVFGQIEDIYSLHLCRAHSTPCPKSI